MTRAEIIQEVRKKLGMVDNVIFEDNVILAALHQAALRSPLDNCVGFNPLESAATDVYKLFNTRPYVD